MKSTCKRWLCTIVVATLVCVPSALVRAGQAPSSPYATWTVTIVLPPRVMAGHSATLAVFGADGKLASGVTVTIDDGQSVTTDRTLHQTRDRGRDIGLRTER